MGGTDESDQAKIIFVWLVWKECGLFLLWHVPEVLVTWNDCPDLPDLPPPSDLGYLDRCHAFVHSCPPAWNTFPFLVVWWLLLTQFLCYFLQGPLCATRQGLPHYSPWAKSAPLPGFTCSVTIQSGFYRWTFASNMVMRNTDLESQLSQMLSPQQNKWQQQKIPFSLLDLHYKNFYSIIINVFWMNSIKIYEHLFSLSLYKYLHKILNFASWCTKIKMFTVSHPL